MKRLARFGLAGSIGFCVDLSVLAAMLHLGWGPIAGRAVSFCAAVVSTYLANALYTFGAKASIGARSFVLYLGASLGGLSINLAIYALLVLAGVPALAALAVASVCALGFNYASYSRILGSPGGR